MLPITTLLNLILIGQFKCLNFRYLILKYLNSNSTTSKKTLFTKHEPECIIKYDVNINVIKLNSYWLI